MLKKILFMCLLVCFLSPIYSQSIKDIPIDDLWMMLQANELNISKQAESLWIDYTNLKLLHEKALETLGSSDSYTLSLESKLKSLEESLRLSVMTVLALESRAMRTFELLENSEDDIVRMKKNRKWWFIGGLVLPILGGGLYAYFTR